MYLLLFIIYVPRYIISDFNIMLPCLPVSRSNHHKIVNFDKVYNNRFNGNYLPTCSRYFANLHP